MDACEWEWIEFTPIAVGMKQPQIIEKFRSLLLPIAEKYGRNNAGMIDCEFFEEGGRRVFPSDGGFKFGVRAIQKKAA